jgi:hypothetical protein
MVIGQCIQVVPVIFYGYCIIGATGQLADKVEGWRNMVENQSFKRPLPDWVVTWVFRFCWTVDDLSIILPRFRVYHFDNDLFGVGVGVFADHGQHRYEVAVLSNTVPHGSILYEIPSHARHGCIQFGQYLFPPAGIRQYVFWIVWHCHICQYLALYETNCLFA